MSSARNDLPAISLHSDRLSAHKTILGSEHSFLQVQTAQDEEVVPVRLILGRIAEKDIDILVRRNIEYMPAYSIFSFLGVEVEYVPGQRTITGKYFKEEVPFRIDGARRTITIDNRTVGITQDDIIIRAEDLYIRPRVFERLFEMKLIYNSRRLTVTIESGLKFPIVIKYERRREEMLRRIYEAPKRPERFFPRRFGWVDGARLDWGVLSEISKFGPGQHSINLHAGGEVAGGNLQSQIFILSKRSISLNHFGGSWSYPFFKEAPIRQVTVGDMITPGALNMSIVGVEITNRPVPYRVVFDRDVFYGKFDPNREVQLFVGGRYIFSKQMDHTGQFEFEVPIRYGVDEFFVRSFSLWGIEQIERYRVYVPQTALPKGVYEYSLMGGKTRGFGSSWVYGGRFAYGLTKHLTFGFGAESYEHLPADVRVRPLVSLVGRLANATVVEVVSDPEVKTTANLHIELENQGRISAGATIFADNRYFNQSKEKVALNLALGMPLYMGEQLINTNISAQQRKSKFVTQNLFQGSMFASLPGFQPGFVTRYVNFKSEYGIMGGKQWQSGGFISGQLPARVFGRFLGTYDHIQKKFAEARVDLNVSPLPSFYVRFSAVRSFIPPATSSLNLFFSYDFTTARMTASVIKRPEGVIYNASARGSISYASQSRLYIYENRGNRVGFGGLFIRPFFDENANGRFDRDESYIKQVRTTLTNEYLLGSIPAAPDGSFRLMDGFPYHMIDVHIDAKRVENPRWVPRFSSFSIRIIPNVIREIPVPFVNGAIISGHVFLKWREQLLPVPGMKVIVEEDGKRSTFNAETFSTGEYEVFPLPPGKFRVFLDEDQLAELGYASDPYEHSVRLVLKPEGDEVRNVDFILTSLRPIEIEPPPIPIEVSPAPIEVRPIPKVEEPPPAPIGEPVPKDWRELPKVAPREEFYAVQVGAYFQEGLQSKILPLARLAEGRSQIKAYIAPGPTGLLRIILGEYKLEEEAAKLEQQLKRGYPEFYYDAFVVRIERDELGEVRRIR